MSPKVLLPRKVLKKHLRHVDENEEGNGKEEKTAAAERKMGEKEEISGPMSVRKARWVRQRTRASSLTGRTGQLHPCPGILRSMVCWPASPPPPHSTAATAVVHAFSPGSDREGKHVNSCCRIEVV